MTAFVTPVLLVVAVGFASAVLLTFAAIFFAVPVNETQAKVRECLPGANCGACGYAGCDDYASALAENPEVPANKCIPGGAATAAAVAAVLGVDAGGVAAVKAKVMCSGFTDCTRKEMDYQGYKSCAAVKQFFGGPGSCKYGCIGLADCVKVCQYGALHICNGVAVVDRESCVGCGMCASVCPQKIIDIIPDASRTTVDCSSRDSGKVTRDLCTVGCIACKLCEKACKFDAVHVENNVAKIDPEKCKNCGMCVKACPRKIIHMIPRPGAKPVTKVVPEGKEAVPMTRENPSVETPGETAE